MHLCHKNLATSIHGIELRNSPSVQCPACHLLLVVLIILAVATFAAFYAIGWILAGFFKGS